MKHEPTIDRERLIATIRLEYGIVVEQLTFVPVGFVAACYIVSCAGDARFFLKLWPDTGVGRRSAAQLGVSLQLTRALHERGLYPRVPYPVLTRNGSLSSTFAGFPFAVFPYYRGSVPPDWPELPLPSRDELARTLAAIHRATPALADVLPWRETFDVAGEVDLRRGLAAIERLGQRERPGRLALRDAVLPRRAEILAQLDRLHGLRDTVRALAGPFVLCHTDMGGDNLLVDDEGRLVVLDWDTATLAPPEHDLWSAAGDGFGRFLEVYWQAGGARPLYVEHFAFCMLRRYVEDLTARLRRILDEDTTEEEDRDLLQGMELWGFSRWAALDQTLGDIATTLGQHA